MMRKAKITILTILLTVGVYFAFVSYRLEKEKITLKKDLIELSNIRYGLFNVDEWKTVLADIISKKVEEFDLNDTNREEMRKRISAFLENTINDFESRYRKKKSKSLFGIIESSAASAFGVFDTIKKDIPTFTDQILDFLDKAENREAIRDYLIKKLEEYADDTFSKTDYSRTNRIVETYGQGDAQHTKTYLNEAIQLLSDQNQLNQICMFVIALLAAVSLMVSSSIGQPEYFLTLALSLIFLIMGVMLPMIEIDARIDSMNFTLLGEEITFEDQVLYYKSKSILEVVELMVSQSRIDLLLVGILVLTFSVLFPLSKLVCSALYLSGRRFRSIGFVSFMVLKSGKWSMADVMVIAIFMAYIGFDGIISEQLKQIQQLSPNLDLLTTNKSNLLYGFYLFTSFVLLSLFTSHRIQRSS